jgi:lysozyme family protein
MTRDEAIDLILKHEGGYANDPRDPGGETKYGISKRAHPNEDIANLTVERAREIYQQEYWNPTAARIHDIAPRLAVVLFDAAVNQGKGFAVQALQGVLHVKQDGIIGPMTIAALQEALDAHGEDWVLAQFAAQRAMRYVQARAWATYGFGWMVRLMATLLAVGSGETTFRKTPAPILAELLDQIANLLKVARSEVG